MSKSHTIEFETTGNKPHHVAILFDTNGGYLAKNGVNSDLYCKYIFRDVLGMEHASITDVCCNLSGLFIETEENLLFNVELLGLFTKEGHRISCNESSLSHILLGIKFVLKVGSAKNITIKNLIEMTTENPLYNSQR
jgi:hypothetical protein